MKLFTLFFLLISNAIAIDSFTLNSEKTLYIVDGDSVSVQMRIAGIDTPEITQPCQKTQHQTIDCGRLAKDYLKKLLSTTPGKLLITSIAIDHYQRILVRVYKGNIDIGKAMVESGMAFSYKDTYRQEEDLAKSKKLGFWGFYKPPIKPYQWRKTNRR
ncbi:MAG: thermonuclease family protein [Gammaproteobacteria bacterium]|nr:thermonuclease family protein [Gammaproteobacteria bacterium]